MAKMATVLLTGFEPFADFKINPSQKIVADFVFLPTKSVHIEKLILPVDFEKAMPLLLQTLDNVQPDLVISLGLQANMGVVQLEKLAINVGFDRYGAQNHFFLQETGENALISHLDIDKLAAELCQKGIPTLRSNHAGTYLCNGIYYHTLQWCFQNGGDAVFVHLPFSTEIAAQLTQNDKKPYPSLPQYLIETAIEHIINRFFDKTGNTI